jgi:UPF0271 protein
MADSIDLNSDLGEGFGAWSMGDDEAMLDIVTSVNVACGFHAGDPSIMQALAEQTQARGIALGAHPGFRDLHGFGRRRIHGMAAEEMRDMIIYQVGALQALARVSGQRVRHVRAHGALGNMTDEDPEMAKVLAAAVLAIEPRAALMTLPGCAADRAASRLDLPVIRQGFADRAYTDDGQLLSRALPGSMILDPKIAADRVLRMVSEGTVESINGVDIHLQVQTVCLHGDSPTAVALAETIRSRLENNGISVRPYRIDEQTT